MRGGTRWWRGGMWVGLVLQLAGMVWDARWHAAHPGAFEHVGDMLTAHVGIYLGVLLTVFAGALAVSTPTAGLSRRDAGDMLVLVGSLIQAVGVVWDIREHALGTEVSMAHAMIRGGLALTIVGLVLADALLGSRKKKPETTR